MASPRAPLLTRPLFDFIARVGQPLPALAGAPGVISTATFLQHVWSLAEQLPDGRHALNLCENRYHFLVGFCAVIVKRQCNLLAQNRGVATQTLLAEKYPQTYVLHDGLSASTALPAYDIRGCRQLSHADSCIPDIELDHLAAITFTSGSTGEPQANCKYWRTFVASTEINAAYMVPATESHYDVLATVPGQHMWGLETSILLPLISGLCIDDGKPLFPQDIQARLAKMRAPRMLISTPVHLRALCLSGLSFPPVAQILCATAPLSQELAGAAETLFQGQLCEIFGCSEVGSMACRHTADTEIWRLFAGLTMQPHPSEPDKIQISAAHLPVPVALQDRVEICGENIFRVLGRGSDMVEIAGKRGSLLEMNQLLQAHPDVIDAVVFSPEEKSPVPRLAALVVLTRPEAKTELSKYLQTRVDPVFVPRPILVVDALPREDNGKLPRQKLLQFYQTLKTKTPP